MSKRKVFALRVDEKLLEKVEKWAEDDFRSTNGQLEWIISEALKKAGRYKSGRRKKDESDSSTD